MSIKAVAWAIEVRVGDPALKILLIAIANYADENRRAWPSQKKLAHDTEMSERTVRRRLPELAELGLIEIENRRHENGEVATSVITLKPTGQFGRKQDDPAAKTAPPTGQNTGSPPATKVSASNEPSENHQIVEPSDSPSLSLRRDAEHFFDNQFWPNFPKRFGSNPKEAAKKKIVAAIINGENPADILHGVKMLYSGLQRNGRLGTEYVPMAVTWINRKQWRDDPMPAGTGKARGNLGFFELATEMANEQ